ncbi:DUF547 domain-containing protein [bacterium]|nr:DUF547 domain-containing protein [bacterium]
MKILTRPNDKAVFLIAAFGVLMAGMALFLVPPKAVSAGGEDEPATTITEATTRPTSRPTSGPTSGPTSRTSSDQPVRRKAHQSPGLLAPAGFPTRTYADLLSKYLADGRVDYAGLKDDPVELKALIRAIETTDPAALDKLDDAAKMAWYANAYNILTIDLIVRHYPIDSIMDIEKAWDTSMIVAGQPMTLNEIEHDVLRLRDEPEAKRRAFVDPRIHFALNCASVGCPDLAPAPFEAGKLETQLDKATRRFVQTPSKFRFEDGTLYLSQLLDWYGEDFQLLYTDATKEQALGRFFADYVADDATAEALRNGDFTIQWLDYDWALNAAQ